MKECLEFFVANRNTITSVGGGIDPIDSSDRECLLGLYDKALYKVGFSGRAPVSY